MVLLRFTKFGRISVGKPRREVKDANFSDKNRKKRMYIAPTNGKKHGKSLKKTHCSRAMLVYVNYIVQFYAQPTYMKQFESQNVKSCRLESMICLSPLPMSRNNMNRTYKKITCVAGMRFGKTNRDIFLVRKWIASKMRIREM